MCWAGTDELGELSISFIVNTGISAKEHAQKKHKSVEVLALY